MAFQLSPGVAVSEIDLTTVVPSVATSIGGFAGKFAWGPINQIVNIGNEVRLADTFGKPTADNYEYWFSAANFLAYSNNLKVVRAANTDTDIATSTNFKAKYPGDLGNSLKVSVADANTYSTWTYATQFTDTPGTSTYVSNAGGVRDEMHVIVIDEDGLISGTQGTVLEKYAFVSKASDAKDDSGNTNYYKNVIANKSKYIHWLSIWL